MDPLSPPISLIKIDGKVVLKLVKYGLEYLPNTLSGQLLGMETDSSLEVTDCYPLSAMDDLETRHYYDKIFPALRDANQDVFPVGVFRCSNLGFYLDMDALENQHLSQKDIRNRITIVIDPLSITNGYFVLKAFRISDSFFEHYTSGNFTAAHLRESKVTFADVWTEVPVQIQNVNLINLWLSSYFIQNDLPPTNIASVITRDHRQALISDIDSTENAADAMLHECRRYLSSASTAAKLREQVKAGIPLKKGRMHVTEPQQLHAIVSMSQLSRYCDALVSRIDTEIEALRVVEGASLDR
ncbi:hypothetical protein GEMRC1_005748 [Eukaryota sp. GEM-RC1]